MEQLECSEMLAHKIQMPENDPEESIQHLEHGEYLKSRNKYYSKQANQIPVCVFVCMQQLSLKNLLLIMGCWLCLYVIISVQVCRLHSCT